ncbi:28S ribosomal protein S7, mitochondrial-like [Ctenocephalides felis]|uniref:28S ribosomal protein S7, mitochondrial-like n=1 Tax=Ctenocephalides felis TaxID=7515 RepID=UPI000E6E5620|nr:28S ribosomal protein S7, mitochondrial-like [Ctenocephalides felis]
MASPKLLLSYLKLTHSCNVKFKPLYIATRSFVVGSKAFSQYASYFIDPVFKPQKQNELAQEGEIQKLAHVPIKAARNNDTSSVFHDDLLSKFTNYVMKGGQKVLARNLIDEAFVNIKRIQIEKYHKAKEENKSNIILNPKVILHNAITNCRPVLTLTPIKRGGVTYQVPIPITEKHSYFLAMKWLVSAAREKERTVHFPEKLAYELIDAANNTGRVVKKKHDLHRQCEANRAYAHYRWS